MAISDAVSFIYNYALIEWPFMLFSTELKSPFLSFLYKFSAVWAGNKSYLNRAVLYVALVGPNSQIQECIDV